MLIAGDYACFTRPELSVERVSYDVPTPSACVGIFEAVYRKPEMRWHIERIHVLKPIRFASVQRAEVNQVASPWRTQINVRDARMLRHATVLRDVAYLVEAHIEALDGNPAKHVDTFRRRLHKGQCWQQPVLGCREFPAHVQPVDTVPVPDPELRGERELGLMLHSLDFSTSPPIRRWYRARMLNGVVQVPHVNSPEVLR